MSELKFSFCPSVVGKDTTEVVFPDKNGNDRSVQRWTMYRNRFTNHSGTQIREVDGVIGSHPFGRLDFMELVAVKGYATAFVLKDDTLMKGRSQGPNILGAHHMMVDFDNTMSMEEAQDQPWFDKCWFAYTTPSFGKEQPPLTEHDLVKLPAHQAEVIKGQVGKPKRNFRLVFKFSRMIEAEEILDVSRGFFKIFPMADTSCKDVARLMFGSKDALIAAPENEYELSSAEIEDLKAMGRSWHEDNKAQDRARLSVVTGTAVGSNDVFSNETEITLASGERVTIQYLLDHAIGGYHEACFSPFRMENSPSAFVKKFDDGNVFCYDSGSNLKYTWRQVEQVGLVLKKKVKPVEEVVEETKPVTEPVAPVTDRELVELEQRKFYPITPSGERKKKVRSFVSDFLSSRAAHAIIRTPEGYGKSSEIVASLIREGKDVLFCTLSNKQADEKMEDFKMYDPVRIWSLGSLIQDAFGVRPIMYESHTPWDDPGMNVEATIAAIVEKIGCTFTEAEEAVEVFRSEVAESRQSKTKLCITTFASGNMLFNKEHGKLDRVVVVDDPSTGDLLTSKFNFRSVNGVMMLDKIAERPSEEVIFGKEWQWQDKVIWTTTEELVMKLIQHQHPEVYVKDIKESIDVDKHVLVLPTNLVRKPLKQILPGIHGVVQEDSKTEQVLISNGIGEKENLVNTKGRNDLMKDTTIIISYPHPCDVAAVTDSMGLDVRTNQNSVRTQMCVDIMDQAIGRSQAYRGKDGSRVLVVCDPMLDVSLRMRSRYSILGFEGIKRRGRLQGAPTTLEFHTHFPEWWAYWHKYIETVAKYITAQGDELYSQFDATKLELTPKERKEVEKLLKKTTEYAKFLMKAEEVMVNIDGTRRNMSVIVHHLIREFNKNKSRGNSGMSKWMNPETGKTYMLEDSKVPPGWTKAPLVRKTKRSL